MIKLEGKIAYHCAHHGGGTFVCSFASKFLEQFGNQFWSCHNLTKKIILILFSAGGANLEAAFEKWREWKSFVTQQVNFSINLLTYVPK